MNYDKKIEQDELTILCSKELENFSNNFIKYYQDNIDYILNVFGINERVKLLIFLTDDADIIDFKYGKSDFAGFFNDTGAFAYINLYGEKDEEYFKKGIMHELIHHLYKFYVYDLNKPRITWVDEGLAQLFSGQKEYLKSIDVYNDFLKVNLPNNENIDLNNLNHEDSSFGNCNGYNLAYIAIRYLFEKNSKNDFLNLITDENKLRVNGTNIIDTISNEYFSIKK